MNGTCDYDLFLITGASSSVPRICGENSNQHGITIIKIIGNYKNNK